MLRKFSLAFAVVVALFAAFVATRPADFAITRSRTLAAPPDVVFPYVSDFHKWADWSPWEQLDPAMQREHSGAPSGTGAAYAWSGNDKVGKGRMTITDTRAPQSLTIRLEFLEPWAATNTTRFEFAPSGSGTQVTWTMSGHNDFVGKAFGVFMNMDAMVGPDFEKGLANLDAATALAARAAPAGPAS